jgi:hypothetical protein
VAKAEKSLERRQPNAIVRYFRETSGELKKSELANPARGDQFDRYRLGCDVWNEHNYGLFRPDFFASIRFDLSNWQLTSCLDR